MTIAAMKAFADALAASNIGYDKSQRWSFYQNGKIIPGREGDCSAVCGAIAKAGFSKVDLTGTFFTGNYASRMKAAGFTVIRFPGLSKLRDGDFLLTPGHHVEFYWGGKMFSARFDENGHGTGGKAGNQNGRETRWVTVADRPGGWTYVCRPPAEAGTKPSIPTFPLLEGWYFGPKEGPTESVSGYYNTRSNGKKGHDGLALAQSKAKALGYYTDSVDGLYGPATRKMVAGIQRAANLLGAKLPVSGKLDAATWPWVWKVSVKPVTPVPVVPTPAEAKIKIKFTRAENIAKYGSGVVQLSMETYLAGVVASEIGESSPVAALRAQAVAARTYAMRYSRAGATIDDTTKYQAYRYSLAGQSPRSVAAIKDTRGQVITYGGSLIQAVYSSSNQGRSTSAKARWGNAFAYLIEQDDPWDVAWRRQHGKATKAHGVGMSQVGAMWAGANGIGYKEILAFYYPGTKVVPNYNL